jgi:glycosyltransferase involved in cell wall biosynthesis
MDARFLTHPQPGGFKTYTENLISALARVDTENEYVLYTDRAYGDLISALNNPNFHGRVVSSELPFVGVPWREQVKLARSAKKDRVDLFHSPCLTAPLNLNCPLVVTVHDMIWAFPEKFSRSGSLSVKRRLMEWYNRMIPAYSSKRAEAVITVSYAARESIMEHLKLKKDHLFVTHEAPNPLFKQVKDEQQIESVRHKYDLPPNFILAIGSADPRKNISRLVQAYSLLSKELQNQYQLVIVWTHSFLAGELSEHIEKLRLANSIRFLVSVPNNDLLLIYNIASLFAFPSLYEGFGLPPLEAMACGVPVVAADNSSIPEIVGDAALLFDAQDVNGMSAVMHQVLTNESVKMRLQKDGLGRSAQFSWDKCGRETIAVYNSVFDKR